MGRAGAGPDLGGRRSREPERHSLPALADRLRPLWLEHDAGSGSRRPRGAGGSGCKNCFRSWSCDLRSSLLIEPADRLALGNAIGPIQRVAVVTGRIDAQGGEDRGDNVGRAVGRRGRIRARTDPRRPAPCRRRRRRRPGRSSRRRPSACVRARPRQSCAPAPRAAPGRTRPCTPPASSRAGRAAPGLRAAPRRCDRSAAAGGPQRVEDVVVRVPAVGVGVVGVLVLAADGRVEEHRYPAARPPRPAGGPAGTPDRPGAARSARAGDCGSCDRSNAARVRGRVEQAVGLPAAGAHVQCGAVRLQRVRGTSSAVQQRAAARRGAPAGRSVCGASPRRLGRAVARRRRPATARRPCRADRHTGRATRSPERGAGR